MEIGKAPFHDYNPNVATLTLENNDDAYVFSKAQSNPLSRLRWSLVNIVPPECIEVFVSYNKLGKMATRLENLAAQEPYRLYGQLFEVEASKMKSYVAMHAGY